jgi:hypothetical protein
MTIYTIRPISGKNSIPNNTMTAYFSYYFRFLRVTKKAPEKKNTASIHPTAGADAHNPFPAKAKPSDATPNIQSTEGFMERLLPYDSK